MGQQQVQGLDYAYTLQGWLKGVNSTGIHSSTPGTWDMGGDGLSSGSNQYVAKDALAFNLNYHYGDYAPINSTAKPFAAVSGFVYSDYTNYKPLYNGNISSMAVSIGQFNNTWLYNYTYDQLNRIKAMDVFDQDYQQSGNYWGTSESSGFTPISPTLDYQERVQYDANGNIVFYNRNQAGNSTTRKMDELQYWYLYKNTGGSMVYYNPLAPVPGDAVELTNKLSYVDDEINAANSTADIDDQEEDNYQYDQIGNLTSDAQAGISQVNWTVYGKIKEIYFDHTGAGEVKHIYYIYDAGGNRIGKRVEKIGPPMASLTTNDYTWYVRDAQGNVMATYNYTNSLGTSQDYSEHLGEQGLVLSEQHLYGSSRLGILSRSLDAEATLDEENILTFTRGNKFFELSNHLGNVLTTIGDVKLPNNTTIGDAVTYYKPVIVTASDYYPFGMLMPGRNYKLNDAYRYGFNGKEQDPEVMGDGNIYDYGFRIYNPRLGRFLSVDPLTKSYPWYTPYQFAGNKPIKCIDMDGLEEAPVGYSFDSKSWKSKWELVKDMGPRDADIFANLNEGLTYTWYQMYDDKKSRFLVLRTTGERMSQADNSVLLVHNYYYWVSNSSPAASKGKYDYEKGKMVEFSTQERSDATSGAALAKATGIVAFGLSVVISALPALAVTGPVAMNIARSIATKAVNAAYTAAAKMILAYYRWAPIIGAIGTKAAEFLDDTGSVGAGSAASKTSSQILPWGKNSVGHLIKHRDVLGFSNVSAQEAQKILPQLRAAANQLLNNADHTLTRVGQWHGHQNAIMYISNGKMLVTEANGTFITVINKTANQWYNAAKPLK